MIISCLEKKYKRLFLHSRGLNEEEICELENDLYITFPKDYKKILQFCSGGKIGKTRFFNFQKNGTYSVFYNTKLLREEINFPKSLLVLYCEYGVKYMDCDPNSLKYGHVMYIGTEDAQCLGDGIEPEYYFDFPSFTDFFEYLLDEEEKLRAEENQ